MNVFTHTLIDINPLCLNPLTNRQYARQWAGPLAGLGWGKAGCVWGALTKKLTVPSTDG